MRDEISNLLREGRGDEAQACYAAYRAAALAPKRGADGRGKLLQEWAKTHGTKLDSLCGKDGAKLRQGAAYASTFNKESSKLCTEHKAEHEHRWKGGGNEYREMCKLSSYSTYLHKYHGSKLTNPGPLSALELPGQYTGHAAPQPECHVTLECVAEPMLVLQSMRLPKRLVFHCSDQAERRFKPACYPACPASNPACPACNPVIRAPACNPMGPACSPRVRVPAGKPP